MKRFFKISVDYNSGEAEVSKTDEWDEYINLFKADILKDLVYDFTKLYEEALSEFYKELKK